jgi:glutathione S-transferase
MYQVYGLKRNRTMRVLWMLEEVGAPYELIEAAPRSDAIKALNPSGKVPALKDGDLVATDSVAICQYLADKHGALTFPAGTAERARQDALTQFTVDQVEGALWTAAKHAFVLPEEHRVAAVKDTCRFEFAQALDHLAAKLGSGPYAFGDTFTVPDLLLGHCVGWAKAAKFELPESGRVADYFAAITSRPALKRAMAS